MGTYMGEKMLDWATQPPKNFYEVIGVLLLATVCGANAIRAYVDQHLSRNPKEHESKTGGEAQ